MIHKVELLLKSVVIILRDSVIVFLYFLGAGENLEYVGHSFANVAHFVFLTDACIRTQRSAVRRRATNLATLHGLCHTSPYLATHLPLS